VHTALREAQEETSLDPQLVQARRPCSHPRRSRGVPVAISAGPGGWCCVLFGAAWHGWHSTGHAASYTCLA